jgi:hypothetical protein
MDDREMHDEISALIGTVAKALDIGDVEVITALEEGRLGLEMKTDESGHNYVEATCDDKSARIYPDAIFRPGCSPDDDADWNDGGHGGGGGCGGGCSCGG